MQYIGLRFLIAFTLYFCLIFMSVIHEGLNFTGKVCTCTSRNTECDYTLIIKVHTYKHPAYQLLPWGKLHTTYKELMLYRSNIAMLGFCVMVVYACTYPGKV
jgi:hypothetical protein